MASYNQTTILGNLTRDPESKDTGKGEVCEFAVAVNDEYTKNDGTKVEDVMFIDVSVWGGQGAACNQYLSSGRLVLVEGRLKQDRWEDDNGGKRSKHRIVARRVVFMPQGKKNNE